MEGVTPLLPPFAYPTERHRRRHGPTGYTNYQRYRPWLEDEFTFRCVYCLKRMVWSPTDVWTVDHIVSRDEALELICDYDNLVLACQCCNRLKSSKRVPDPCRLAYGWCLRVNRDGSITPLNQAGDRLIRDLRLNDPRYQRMREQKMRDLQALAKCDPAGFEKAMGFPPELPDLAALNDKLQSPNIRPEGLQQSWLAKKRRGELPIIY
jgi:hypothetical protein